MNSEIVSSNPDKVDEIISKVSNMLELDQFCYIDVIHAMSEILIMAAMIIGVPKPHVLANLSNHWETLEEDNDG